MGISLDERRLRVSLCSGARSFDLRLNAAFTPPSGWPPAGGNRFSVVLRLWGFVLEVKSEAPGLFRRISFRSSLRRLFQGILRRSGSGAETSGRRSLVHRLRGISLGTPDRKRVARPNRVRGLPSPQIREPKMLGDILPIDLFQETAPSTEDRGGVLVYGIVFFLHLLALTPHFPASRASWILAAGIFSSKSLQSLRPEAAWSIFILVLSLANFILLPLRRSLLSKSQLMMIKRSQRPSRMIICTFLIILFWLGRGWFYKLIEADVLGSTSWTAHLLSISHLLSNIGSVLNQCS